MATADLIFSIFATHMLMYMYAKHVTQTISRFVLVLPDGSANVNISRFVLV